MLDCIWTILYHIPRQISTPPRQNYSPRQISTPRGKITPRGKNLHFSPCHKICRAPLTPIPHFAAAARTRLRALLTSLRCILFGCPKRGSGGGQPPSLCSHPSPDGLFCAWQNLSCAQSASFGFPPIFHLISTWKSRIPGLRSRHFHDSTFPPPFKGVETGNDSAVSGNIIFCPQRNPPSGNEKSLFKNQNPRQKILHIMQTVEDSNSQNLHQPQ